VLRVYGGWEVVACNLGIPGQGDETLLGGVASNPDCLGVDDFVIQRILCIRAVEITESHVGRARLRRQRNETDQHCR
jgi:hypothetical protein